VGATGLFVVELIFFFLVTLRNRKVYEQEEEEVATEERAKESSIMNIRPNLIGAKISAELKAACRENGRWLVVREELCRAGSNRFCAISVSYLGDIPMDDASRTGTKAITIFTAHMMVCEGWFELSCDMPMRRSATFRIADEKEMENFLKWATEEVRSWQPATLVAEKD